MGGNAPRITQRSSPGHAASIMVRTIMFAAVIATAAASAPQPVTDSIQHDGHGPCYVSPIPGRRVRNNKPDHSPG